VSNAGAFEDDVFSLPPDSDLPQLPESTTGAIASWERIIHNAPGDKRGVFQRAAIELARLAAPGPPHVAQIIFDSIYDLAAAAGLDDDEAQQFMADARLAPPDVRPGTKQSRRINGSSNTPPDEPPPAMSPDEFGSPVPAITDERALVPVASKPRALDFLDPSEWQGQLVPTRRWLVPNRIPRANVTILNGDGAAGKTTIALQLVEAAPCGGDWLGSIVDEPGPAIFLTAEEDRDEIHRRLAAIVVQKGKKFSDLSDIQILCLPGEDAVLGLVDGRSGIVRPTPLFDGLLLAATTRRPALIVIEAAADVFAGNENDRAQVRQFIGLLRRLAMNSGAAVMLIAHPSLTGLASGTGSSGSTAWNNSARSRLYFTGAKKGADDGDDETDVRELRVMKSNYGPAGEIVRLRWQRGVFVPASSMGTLERVNAEAEVDQAYLDCLDATQGSGRQVGPYTGKAYAPAIFEKMQQAKGYRAKALATAQERLFNAGRIEVRKDGPPSKALDRIFRKARP
jgi:RecA-family ATPase